MKPAAGRLGVAQQRLGEAFNDLILRSALLRASRRMAASRVLPSFETLASQAPQDEAVFFAIENAGSMLEWLLRSAYRTVIVIGSDITGGTCGMWVQSASSSCSVCLPFGNVTRASVWPPPKCL